MAATAAEETGQVTGTKDKDYNIIWFVEQCLQNVLRLETYIQDAERDGDSDLADFFRRAQGESRKGAEQGKELLRARLAEQHAELADQHAATAQQHAERAAELEGAVSTAGESASRHEAAAAEREQQRG